MAETSSTGPAYITRGVTTKCSKGSDENYLNLKVDHGVVCSATKDPLMNANDHKPEENIPKYGVCSGSWNPSVLPGLELLEQGASYFLTGHGGGLCSPVTPLAWTDVNKKHILDGAPALTENSKLACVCGGVITIVPIPEKKAGEPNGDNGQGNAGK